MFILVNQNLNINIFIILIFHKIHNLIIIILINKIIINQLPYKHFNT